MRSQLNWTQYRLLSRIEDTDKRAFYIAESIKNHWTSRQLERQMNSLLYERRLMSNDKESVLTVANDEKQVSEAKEIIKDPMFLEFLGLKQESSYYEKELEQAIQYTFFQIRQIASSEFEKKITEFCSHRNTY